MRNIASSPIIRDIRANEKQDFCCLLVAAFQNDPLFQTVFTDEHLSEKHMLAFVAFLFDKGMVLNETIKVYIANNVLQGAYILQSPIPNTPWQNIRLAKNIASLIVSIPFSSVQLLNNYMRQILSVQSRRSQYYLTMIAVHPNAQGRGVGKKLLTNILEEVDANIQSEGIGLDTENPDNISLYEHFGFSLVETLKIDTLSVYCMFRPRSEGKL